MTAFGYERINNILLIERVHINNNQLKQYINVLHKNIDKQITNLIAIIINTIYFFSYTIKLQKHKNLYCNLSASGRKTEKLYSS